MAYSKDINHSNSNQWLQCNDTIDNHLEIVQSARSAANIFQDTHGNQLDPILQNQPKGMDPDGPKIFKRQSSFRLNQSTGGYSTMDTSQQFSYQGTHCVDSDPIGSYFKRLKTFESWPRWACAHPEAIALAGMSYIGVEDKSQCDFCRGILYSWDYTDKPLEEHAKHFDLCPFIQGQTWKVVQQYMEQIKQQAQLPQPKEITSNGFPASQSDHTGTLGQCPTLLSNHPGTDHNLNRVIDIVTSIGYGDNIIQQAIKMLTKTMSKDQINSDVLLDCVFDLEGKEGLESDTEVNELCGDVNAGLHVGSTNTTVLNSPLTDRTVLNDPLIDSTVLNGPLADNTVLNGQLTDSTVLNSPLTNDNLLARSSDLITNNVLSSNSPRYANCAFNYSAYNLSPHHDISSANCAKTQSKYSEHVTHEETTKSIARNDLEEDCCDSSIEGNNHTEITTQKHGGDDVGNKQTIKKHTHLSNSLLSLHGKSIEGKNSTENGNESEICTRPRDISPEKPSKNSKKKDTNTKKVRTAEESAKISKLVEQRDNLQKSVMCNVCNNKKIELLFLPCRHMVACDSCGSKINSCLICSKEIVATVRIYII